MSGSGWPGEDQAETQVMALPREQRELLSALAVVRGGSLSPAELADLVEAGDVQGVLDELARRSLVRRDERGRYSASGTLSAQLRASDAALASGERLLGYMTTLARTGSLTPGRLAEEAEAILGLSEWAAERRRWAGLLELVKTLQAGFELAERLQQWLVLLERGRQAAEALGDRTSELWLLERLVTASERVGDQAAADGYRREAELRRSGQPAIGQQAAASSQAAAGRSSRTATWALGLVVAAVAGIGAGFLIGHNGSSSAGSVTTVPVTVTAGGTVVTKGETVTLPATTVTETETTTVTETTTETTTTATLVP